MNWVENRVACLTNEKSMGVAITIKRNIFHEVSEIFVS
jgi:hypothetical protein